jgi:predicted AlkP superfamily pyrophosphatase or phosphodiesterase
MSSDQSNPKVILVVSDGMSYDAAVNGMGYLMHLVERKLASLYKVIGELPTRSRPMYETIHTGVPVSEHGIVSNGIIRRSKMVNIFELAVKAGKTTAAAAYYWYSELYNRAPYDRIDDREVNDKTLLIQHGRFYTRDEYPDVELFATAGMLVRKYSPDYLLVHPSGMDYHGETFGSNTPEYRKTATRQDSLLANLIPEWMEKGYTILFTGDHGVNPDGMHGGTTPDVRHVPLFIIRPGITGEGDTNKMVSMLQFAPTICSLMSLPIPETMKATPLV